MSKRLPLEAEVTRQVRDAARMLGIPLERRNVGGMTNARGQYAAFGTAGAADWTSVVPTGPNRGRRLEIEIKREAFDPRAARGKEAERFQKQLMYLRLCNLRGGLGTWLRSGFEAVEFFKAVMAVPGLYVSFDVHGFPKHETRGA